MSVYGPSDVEIRVLGCLIEKQRATPDQYPLTLNSLRLACNQSTNRDPVVDYDEATIREALGALGRRRWIRSASGHTSRVAKYRHLLEEELKLTGEQMSILAVLMLRGEQTPGELKQRTERLFGFEDLDAVHLELEGLIERGLAERLPRRPGQKEERFRQLLGGDALYADDEEPAASAPAIRAEPSAQSASAPAPSAADASPVAGGLSPGAGSAAGGADPELARRVTALEEEVAELRRQIAGLAATPVGEEASTADEPVEPADSGFPGQQASGGAGPY